MPKFSGTTRTEFVNYLIEDGFAAIERTLRGHVGGDGLMHLVIAHGKNVAEVYDNGYVQVNDNGVAVIGSGGSEALGYLGDRTEFAEEDAIEAVRRAALFRGSVGGPIKVANTRDLTVRTA
jgi:ATP-dependent protease HslVU (ClpYQ) peptidase subunit